MGADEQQKSGADDTRPLPDVLRSGIGWGFVFAVFLPVAVVVVLLAPDGTGSGGMNGSGSTTAGKGPRPRRRLQYSITAATTSALLLAALVTAWRIAATR